MIGLHSVMLKPDSVRRVTPPTTITANTKADEKSNQRPTASGGSTGSGAVGEFTEKNRGFTEFLKDIRRDVKILYLPGRAENFGRGKLEVMEPKLLDLGPTSSWQRKLNLMASLKVQVGLKCMALLHSDLTSIGKQVQILRSAFVSIWKPGASTS